jgi:superoxide dismutase, Cu-Zn family
MIPVRHIALLSGLLLLVAAGCGDPDPQGPAAAGPIDPDTVHAERDTVATPLGAPETMGRSEAEAMLESVGGSGVSGRVTFHDAGDGTLVVAEIGGLEPGTHGLRILDARRCDRIEDTSPFDPAGVRHADPEARPTGSLDEIEVMDDGTGRYESLHPGVHLAGERSVMGRAVVAIEGGHHHTAHPDDRVVACGVISPAGPR